MSNPTVHCPKCGGAEALYSPSRKTWNCAPCGGFWFAALIEEPEANARLTDSLPQKEEKK